MTVPESPDLPRRWRILPHRSPRAAEDLRDCLVIRNGGFFLLTDSNGNLPADNAKALGLYRDDTRYLSPWTLEIAGAELLPILSNADLGFAMEQVFICPELVNERRETVPAGERAGPQTTGPGQRAPRDAPPGELRRRTHEPGHLLPVRGGFRRYLRGPGVAAGEAWHHQPPARPRGRCHAPLSRPGRQGPSDAHPVRPRAPRTERDHGILQSRYPCARLGSVDSVRPG